MPGGTDYESVKIPLGRPAPVTKVYRRDSPTKYTYLPDIKLVDVSEHQYANPSNARLRYRLSAYARILDADAPVRAEEAWGQDVVGWRRLLVNQRIMAVVFDPASDTPEDYAIAFEGFVTHSQLDVGDEESVTLVAAGVPVRLWDSPILTIVQRDASDPKAGKNKELSMRCQFNPDGEPNCTQDDYDVAASGGVMSHPVFIDELSGKYLFLETPSTAKRWSLSGAVRYLLATKNPDETFVKNPPVEDVLHVLDSREAVSGPDDPYDPNDSSTYDENPIYVSDLDVTGDVLPVAIQRIIEPHGFAFKFKIYKDSDGDPQWKIVFYRLDAQDPLKVVKLARPGQNLDLLKTNVTSVNIVADGEVVNAWEALCKPTMVEAGFVLRPLFKTNPGDADLPALNKFIEGDGGNPLDRTTYRNYGLDELGEFGPVGTTPPALGSLFDEQYDPDPARDPRSLYVVRRRPGREDVVTRDTLTKRRLRSRLYISKDYEGPVGELWDRSGTWQQVTGGWENLNDRCGITLTSGNPDVWNIGLPGTTGTVALGPGPMPYPAGNVRAIKGACNPASGVLGDDVKFTLMYMTMIEMDTHLGAIKKKKQNGEAKRLDESPIIYSIKRADEVRDRFCREVVDRSSPLYDIAAKPPRDDFKPMKSHLEARRASKQAAQIAGTVLIPRLTYVYEVGDRIAGVRGRGLDFATTIRTSKSPAVYPSVAGITWTFEQRGQTSLSLTDRRADPPAEHRTNSGRFD